MLYLRDLLPAGKKVKVEYRCDGPVDEYGDTEDMLFGFAIRLIRIPYEKRDTMTLQDLGW